MNKVVILCSGFGLGFYIPGVLLKNVFLNMGYDAEVEVFESYMANTQQAHIDITRREYHENFAKAIIASKLPLNSEKSIDYNKVDILLKKWRDEKQYLFISLSGHWIYILERYRKVVDWNIWIDGLYIDADLAPSWKSLRKYIDCFETKYNPIWMYDKKKLSMNFSLGTSLFMALNYDEREHSVVIHGGGWGMGTYRETVNELLEQTDLKIALVAYAENEMEASERVISYMNSADWCAWKQKEGNDFPPYVIKKDGEMTEQMKLNKQYHWLLELTSRQKAIIAKPGAGTLIDSFITETPVILLKPFGTHEQKNWEVWQRLGFGIPYDVWQGNGFCMESLKEASKKIKDYKSKVIRYEDYYVSHLEKLNKEKIE